MRKNTLVNTLLNPSTTGYEEIIASTTSVDVRLDALVVTNTTSGSLNYKVAIAENGGDSTSAVDIVSTTALAANTAANAIDGFVVPLTGGQKVFILQSGDGLNFRAIGEKASEGNLTTRAVLGS